MSGLASYQTDGRFFVSPLDEGEAADMYDRMTQGLIALMNARPDLGTVDLQVDDVDPDAGPLTMVQYVFVNRCSCEALLCLALFVACLVQSGLMMYQKLSDLPM